MLKLVLLFCVIYGIYFLNEGYNKFKINRKFKKCEKNLPEIEEIKPELNLTPAQIRYHEYLKTEHWQSLRQLALKRAGYRCQVCAREFNLQVHHNTYVNRGKEEIFDLCVLCSECHDLFTRRYYYKNLYKKAK